MNIIVFSKRILHIIFVILITIYTNLQTFAVSDINSNEVRIGVMQHDLNKHGKHKHERGQNITAEYIFNNDHQLIYGAPHFGVSINNQGYSSYIYTGLTWRYHLCTKIFIEGTLGGSLTNSERKIAQRKQALGSNLLFRESFSIGVYSGDYTMSLMIDHLSNGGIAYPNPGFTGLGIRIGYRL